MRILYILFAAMLVSGPHQAHAQQGQELTVAAALSLKGAFEEAGARYQGGRPGERILFNFAASGVLQRQIEGGAPADVFASASPREMDDLERKQMLAAGSRRTFARNAIVLIVPAGGKSFAASFPGLREGNVRRIAIGNPATVPAGTYAEEVLRHFNVLGSLRGRFVFAENVRQVIDYVSRGEVDAGIVFATDAIGVPGIAVAATAPSESHAPAVYHIAVVRGAKHEAAARAFIDLLLSGDGQEVLKRRGFLPAAP